jgi:capsular exopolysaccharide synthesis family protein
VDDLDLLPSGESPSSPAELLNSPTFIRALKELTSRYDRIVVDSSPLLSVTDARILGAICDATVLVMRAEKSTHQVVDQAVDELLDVGGRVLGGVINAVPRGSNRYGRYSHYGYRRKARPRKARQSKSPSDPVTVESVKK